MLKTGCKWVVAQKSKKTKEARLGLTNSEILEQDAGIFAQISRSKYHNILGSKSTNLSEIY